MNVNFNFKQGSLDFLKSIRKRYIALCFGVIIIFCCFIFRDEIKIILFEDEKNNLSKKDSKKVKKDSVKILKDSIKKINYSSKSMLNDKLNLIEIMQDIVSSYDIDYINVNKFRDSLRKMDCVVEQNKPIHLPRIRKLQNWDTRPFIEKIAYVRRNEWVYIPNLYKDPDPYFSKTIPKYGIESVYYVAIYNYNVIESDGEPQFWGFVSYGWSKPTNISQKDLAALLKEKYRFEEYILKK